MARWAVFSPEALRAPRRGKKGLVFPPMLRASGEFPCFVICMVVVFAEANQVICITYSYGDHLSIYEKG